MPIEIISSGMAPQIKKTSPERLRRPKAFIEMNGKSTQRHAGDLLSVLQEARKNTNDAPVTNTRGFFIRMEQEEMKVTAPEAASSVKSSNTSRSLSPMTKYDSSTSLFKTIRRSKRSHSPHKSPQKRTKSTKNHYYNRPIQFFKHSPPLLDTKNNEQIKELAQNKQVKQPLTLIFSHRRHSSGSTSNNTNTIASSLSDDIPQFSSRFEGGNLQQVWRDAAGEYYLFLQSDGGPFNSLWFHFFVSNLRFGGRYVFHICNISNRANNYAPGYQPVMRVGVDSKYWMNDAPDIATTTKSSFSVLTGGWKRFGQNCVYFKTMQPELKKRARILLGPNKAQRSRKLHTLRFEFTIQKDMERALCSPKSGMFFAFSYPYTYSDLCKNITRLERDVNKHKVKLRVESLCSSVHGRDTKILTISSAKNSGRSSHLRRRKSNSGKERDTAAPATDENESNVVENAVPEKRSSKKPIIFISARVHAGEVSSSHTLAGILDYLCLSTTLEARTLRANFIFRVVPMLSPDGVIDGCQRNSPTNSNKSSDDGVNLNEIYNEANKKQHPTIYSTKRVIKKLTESTRKIALYLDLHGHYNASLGGHFMYGYTNEINLGNTSLPIYQFPRFVESECRKVPGGSNVFVHRDEFIRSNTNRKAGVGPVFFSAEQGIENAFTVETCMHSNGEHQYTPLDYYFFGRVLCNAIYKTFEQMCEK